MEAICYSETLVYFQRTLYTVHCTDEQHAMSSHESQSAMVLTVEFYEMYYTR
jgi:hypothetical protein